VIRKGILKAFTAGTYLADVQLAGSIGNYLTGIPTSRGIPSAEMVAARHVAVLSLEDDTSPSVNVIIAVWT